MSLKTGTSDISVILCTYNRGYHLKNVLKSLSEQNVPARLKWEIIVVDNNSSDDTFSIAKNFSSKSNISIKYVKEKKQGLSYARNRGIIESKSKYVAFTDDDAVVDRNWLTALYDSFQQYKCECVGGRIYLKPVKKLPRWLKKKLWGFLGFLDYGDRPFEVGDERIFGGNMAILKEFLNKTGYFNTELGRNASSLTGGEEAELIIRLKKAGGKVIYQPDAVVYHIVGHEKLKKQYFRKLHYYEGVAASKFYDKLVKRTVFSIPLFIFPQLLRSIIRYIKNPVLRMQMNIWWYIGFITERIRGVSHLKGLRSETKE